ncbi:hypothetical protein ACQP1V_11665 [Microtetraspora malaysiensis]|uniref:hypothetical protein n=1 Tax=Microtetraspora malaysiensis TaxID=161358 RepID=UPI003D90C9D3
MPVPPKQVKVLVEEDADSYAFTHWPQLGEVTVRWKGSFGYLTGHFDDDESDEGFPLARIEYLGDPDAWGFAIYRASSEDYEPSILPSGSRVGTPSEALECACRVHLAESEG